MDDQPQEFKLFAIYDHPEDYPYGFVVREWIVTGGGTMAGEGYTAATLEEARGLLPAGVALISGRDPQEPTIVETWA